MSAGSLKVWLPNVAAGAGADVFMRRLGEGLRHCGVAVTETRYAKIWEVLPWRLCIERPPPGAEITVANSAWGFAMRRRDTKLVVITHHCVFDPVYAEHRSLAQRIFHRFVLGPYEGKSFAAADAVVAVSRYTAESVAAAFDIAPPRVILNGIETDFFMPDASAKRAQPDGPVRLLFTGNLTRRKGADLLPKIMERLGPGYELYYTSGLRTDDSFRHLPGMHPLGRLSREQLREAYRAADLLLFPTRLEGFGYAAAEAMACGTPVVTTDCSSLPELVEDGVTGRLCPVDDVEAFASAVRGLVADRLQLAAMGSRAREVAVERFGLDRMAQEYVRLFEGLTASGRGG